VSPQRAARKRTLTETQLRVARRFRDERELERFSQHELACEIGITRAALASFELGHNPLAFRAGFEFCRHLDIHPRWLAIGEEPKRPFIPMAELGIAHSELRKQMRRGVDFLSGYRELLERPAEAWVKRHTMADIIERTMRAGPEGAIRRMSGAELCSQLQCVIAAVRSNAISDSQRGAQLEFADLLAGELTARWEAYKGQNRKSRS